MATPRNSNLAWQRIAPTLATFVLLVLVVACLYWAKQVLMPVAVALLLSFMLGPAVTWLQRRGLPKTPAVLVVVTLAGVFLSAAVWLLASNVIQLVADLPTYQDNIAKRIAEVREQGNRTLLRNVQRFVHDVAAASAQSPATLEPTEADNAVTVRVVERAAASSVAGWIRSLLPVAEPFFTAGLVIVLVVYLLIFREDLRSRILALVGRGQLTMTTKALDDAGRRISRYLLAQFGLNFAFGACIGLGLLALRVPHAGLWGIAAGLLRYVPYLGPWMAATLTIGMSLMVSEGWAQPMEVAALFLVCEFLSNLVVEPLIYGQSIGVSPAAFMLAIVFWAWLWGPLGMVLAAPMTMCLAVLGKYVPDLKFFDVLLGDEPVLAADVSLYQRLLARDEDEAAEIVRRQSMTLSPVELCDQVLVPAIVHARQDVRAGLLSGDEYEFVLAAIRALADHQDLAAQAAAVRKNENGGDVAARPAIAVLACPAQDAAETTALELFQQLIDPHAFDFDIISAKYLVSEVLQRVSEREPAVICIAALHSGGLAHTRHLCKRIRSRFGNLKIVIGRWTTRMPLENRNEWLACGADYVGTTFDETLTQLRTLAQFLRPEVEQSSQSSFEPLRA